MTMYNWKKLLEQINDTILSDKDLCAVVDNPDTLFNPAASEEQILKNQNRLETDLPPSYKSFLSTSNGFKILNNFYWDIFPIEKVQWLKDFDQDLIDAWLKPPGLEVYPAVGDEEYYVYDQTQNSTWVGPSYMAKSLAIS